jgi:hypothetical protein
VVNTVQIKCISRTERMSPHERVTHVGGYESSQWKMTLNEIESGEQAFFDQAHRRTVGIICSRQPFRRGRNRWRSAGYSSPAPRMPLTIVLGAANPSVRLLTSDLIKCGLQLSLS